MKFKDELFEKYEIRKSKKQKTAFIEWVTDMCKDKNWEVNVEKSSFGVRNVVIGNAEEAEVIFTAHYDTCANMIVPNFITPKNVFIYLLYQILFLSYRISLSCNNMVLIFLIKFHKVCAPTPDTNNQLPVFFGVFLCVKQFIKINGIKL